MASLCQSVWNLIGMLKVVDVFQNGFLNFSCVFFSSNAPKHSYLTPKERYSLNHEKRVWHSNDIKHGNCHFLANFLKTMSTQMCHQHSIFLKTLEGMSGWINILLSIPGKDIAMHNESTTMSWLLIIWCRNSFWNGSFCAAAVDFR